MGDVDGRRGGREGFMLKFAEEETEDNNSSKVWLIKAETRSGDILGKENKYLSLTFDRVNDPIQT